MMSSFKASSLLHRVSSKATTLTQRQTKVLWSLRHILMYVPQHHEAQIWPDILVHSVFLDILSLEKQKVQKSWPEEVGKVPRDTLCSQLFLSTSTVI